MSLFSRSFITLQPTSHPLFRFHTEFEHYPRSMDWLVPQHLKTFTPKFDVEELSDSYEVHGELPGIEQKDIEIEFTDSQTLTIRGHTECSHVSGTPLAEPIESAKRTGAITEHGAEHKSHKATVEDADAHADADTIAEGQHVAHPTKPKTEIEPHPKHEPDPAREGRFWVSERSVGAFARSFSFPVRVDQDAVRASMRNGVLSIRVPKNRRAEGRKITID